MAAAVVVLAAGTFGFVQAAEPSAPGARTTAVSLCGVTDLARVLAADQPAVPKPRMLVEGQHITGFARQGELLHVLDRDSATLRSVPLRGGGGGLQVPLGFRVSAPQVVADPVYGLYVTRYPRELVKISPAGQVLWAVEVPGQEIDAIYEVGAQVGVVVRGAPGSRRYDSSGRFVGPSPISGQSFGLARNGDVLSADTQYIRRHAPAGQLRLVAGDSRSGAMTEGGPLRFHQLGGVAEAADGSVLAADAPYGVRVFDRDGLARGLAPDGMLGRLTERSDLVVVGDELLYAAGGRFSSTQGVYGIPVADVVALAARPTGDSPRMGLGAGLVAGAPGAYFRPGVAPVVQFVRDAWWGRLSGRFELRYEVRDHQQVRSGSRSAVKALRLSGSRTPIRLDLALPPAEPGAYEVDARMYRDGRPVGGTCLRYTVGAPGAELDVSKVTGNPDPGGPAPARGVVLADQLGIDAVRAQIDWGRLLPNQLGAMDFSAYDEEFRRAAAEARRRNVSFHVQVGQGGPERALVDNGTWELRVFELVQHFRGVVTTWEAWNEPNNTFGPPDEYVAKVLAPFHRAVKLVDPTNTVVGGSVLGMDLGYWAGIATASGLASMDIAAIHPYPGHNRSWEEQGIPSTITGLRDLFSRHGRPTLPIWDTESAWWSTGPAAFWSQGDKVSRALLWGRLLGVARWAYFVPEGECCDSVDFSLIGLDGAVKPAALAMMTTSAMLRGRPAEGLVTTGIPGVYAARFGGPDSLLALWSDDVRVAVSVGGDYRAVDVLGRPVSRVTQVTGSPVFLRSQRPLTLRGASSYGPSLSLGGAASATSSGPANPASRAIDGVVDAAGRGEYYGGNAWYSGVGDRAPVLTVRLPRRSVVGGVRVMSSSVGSVVPGIRAHVVEVRDGSGGWQAVGRAANQFFDRGVDHAFAPRAATEVRVRVLAVNFTGYAGGGAPWFWPVDAASTSDPTKPWYGPAVVTELSVYR